MKAEHRSVSEVPLNIVARVGKVCMGKNMRYVVAYHMTSEKVCPIPSHESITFALQQWEGSSTPQKGDEVILFNVELTDNGWRARRALPFRKKDLISSETIRS